MQGTLLRFYLTEKQSHDGILLWEWLLEKANAIGVRGGSAFRAIGGFGRRHAVHENRFFDLAGDTAIEVEFVVSEDEARQLLELCRVEAIGIFYTMIPASFGVVGAGDAA